MFLVGECGGFARRAARDDPVRSHGDLPFDQFGERPLVQLAFAERRDNRHQRACEHGRASYRKNSGIASPFTKSSYVSRDRMTWISPSLISASGTRGRE